MSHLIHLRQRIKAIKTIKKITHALRLISMSAHLRLRSKKNGIEEYKNILQALFKQVELIVPDWNKNEHVDEQSKNRLIILVGSQKGLCGNFNAELFNYFERAVTKQDKMQLQMIVIGKKAHEFATLAHWPVLMAFDEFSMANLTTLTQTLVAYSMNHATTYSSIEMYSNVSKTFFVQKPQHTLILPFHDNNDGSKTDIKSDEYIWDQEPTTLMQDLFQKVLTITIYELLFQSLVSEQAARFIAMDNATRSATDLLNSMQIQYNKMRQSKITGELTDLIGGFF